MELSFLLKKVFVVMLITQSQLSFGYGVADDIARNITNKIKPRLPLKSGSTTLVDVNHGGGVLVYEHTLDVDFPPENKLIVIDWLRGQAHKSACSVNDLRSFIQNGGALHYRFFYQSYVLTSIKVERC